MHTPPFESPAASSPRLSSLVDAPSQGHFGPATVRSPDTECGRPEQLHCGPWIVEVAGPERVATRVLRHGEGLTIGRGPGVDLRVADAELRPVHAELRAQPDGLRVRDPLGAAGIRVGAMCLSDALIVEAQCGFVAGRTRINVKCASRAEPSRDSDDIVGLVGASAVMRRLGREIHRFAKLRATILLQGESGTGKDVVARALHALSGRTGPFIALNVGGMNENVADTELFGHRKGAFTGAAYSRPGVFEAASGGTLFLDEIADLHPSIQVKLLRVLEDQQVRPLGTHETININTRVICASWAELQDRVDAGRFRADLYHRVSTIRLELPPLRSRKEDLLVLSEHLLGRHSAEFGVKELTPAASARLQSYEWPGNVRELGSVLYRAAAEATGRTFIDAAEIENALPPAPRRRVAGVDTAELLRLLEANGGNVSAAARAARVPRSTFRTLLKREAQHAGRSMDVAPTVEATPKPSGVGTLGGARSPELAA
jgi:transcriptional regulator with AAA-type ATPase domain